MLNHCIIVGKLVEVPEIEKDNSRPKAGITLEVPRPYKNVEGIYENDYIDCELLGGIAESTAMYIKKGDLMAVKGRIQTRNVDGSKAMLLIAEKVTFLSANKDKDEKQDIEINPDEEYEID